MNESEEVVTHFSDLIYIQPPQSEVTIEYDEVLNQFGFDQLTSTTSTATEDVPQEDHCGGQTLPYNLRSPLPIIEIRPELKSYCELIFDSENDDRVKIKCLYNNCNAIFAFNHRNKWHNFQRHLKRKHNTSSIDGGSSNSEKHKSANLFKEKEIKSVIYAPDFKDAMRSPFVRLERLKTQSVNSTAEKSARQTPPQTPSVTELVKTRCIPIAAEDESTEGNRLIISNYCAICGNFPDKRTLNEQEKNLSTRKNDLTRALCKLLNLSGVQFVNFFDECIFCKECYVLIRNVVDKFVVLERIEQEIFEYKEQVKKLLQNNYKEYIHATSEENDKAVISMLMNEIGYSELELQNRNGNRSRRSCANISNSKSNADLGSFSEDDVSVSETGENNSEHEHEEEADQNTDQNNKSQGRYDRISKRIRMIKCDRPGCRSTFATEVGKSRHIYLSHDKISTDETRPVFKCEICEANGIQRLFSNRKSFTSHCSRHRLKKDGSWTCDICDKTFLTLSTIKKHKEFAHAQPNELDCQVCGIRLPNKEELSCHSLLHKTETPFFCVLCQILTTSSVDLKRHMVTNHSTSIGDGNSPRRLKCEFVGCQKTFSSVLAFKMHMRRHQKDAEHPYKCPQCPVICSGKGVLMMHLSKHSDAALFQCDICGACLKYKKGLLIHRQRHEVLQTGGTFKYECKICSKSFNSTQRLRRHEEIHSGVAHLCDICGKKFNTNQGLEQHHRTHFKDKYPTYKRPNRWKKRTTQNQEGRDIILI